MKKIFKIISIFCLVFVLFNVSNRQQQNENELIIGVWHIEGNPLNYLFTINNDNTAVKSFGNDFTTTYYTWEITEGHTPSGLTISHLVLTNTNDQKEYVFEINALTEELLVLVYQRPGGGLGKLTTYHKQ